jgi:hypothetical protein
LGLLLFHDICLETHSACFSAEPFELAQHKGCKGSLEKWAAEELVVERWSHQWQDERVVARVLVMPPAGVQRMRRQDSGLGMGEELRGFACCILVMIRPTCEWV